MQTHAPGPRGRSTRQTTASHTMRFRSDGPRTETIIARYWILRGSSHQPRLRDGRCAGLDAAQRVAAQNPLPTHRALVEFEVRDGVGLSLDFAGPIPADLLN